MFSGSMTGFVPLLCGLLGDSVGLIWLSKGPKIVCVVVPCHHLSVQRAITHAEQVLVLFGALVSGPPLMI